MPIATYKTYKCPKCGRKKTILQGDCITSFQICKKCGELMELQNDEDRNIFTIFKEILNLKGKI